MARLVFVHGVATRSGPGLDAAETTMRQLFTATVFNAVPFEMFAPRWGDLVPAVPPAVYATRRGAESFSISADAEEGGIGAGPAPASGASIGAIATTHPQLAIDAVLAAMVDNADAANRPLSADELKLFDEAVNVIGDKNAAAGHIGGAIDDNTLGVSLGKDIESFGIGSNPVSDAIRSVTDRIRNIASGLAWGPIGGEIRPAVGLFAGDVFAYLNDGALRAEIRMVVRTAITEALASRAQSEPLIFVGHSLGGVILVDMLADLSAAQLPADLKVDCLFTVGSQAGLFQAVGGLTGGAPAAGATVPARPCVARWMNVFDPIDPLAFAATPLFAGVEDLEFNSITGVASAHTTYFKRPQFYARFRARLSELALIR